MLGDTSNSSVKMVVHKTVLHVIILWFDVKHGKQGFPVSSTTLTQICKSFFLSCEQHGGRQWHSHFVCHTAAVKLLSSVPLR